METSVKLRCSLKWLAGVISEDSFHQKPHVCSLLLNPYQDGVLKRELIGFLTRPNLYLSVYSILFPGGDVESSSFEPLIHSLARKGGYVMEDGDVIVSDSMLAQTKPFREMSHLALLDVLMTLYAFNIVTTQRIVKAIRKISTFNASRELPSKIKVDQLLILWLNKVSGVVCAKHLEEVNGPVCNLDPRDQKKNKGHVMKSRTTPPMPLIVGGDLYCGIYDGQSLAALLLHYCPQHCSWSDFNFGDWNSLSPKQILRNLQLISNYCYIHLPGPAFHLSPIDMIQYGKSELLHSNILVLLAHLFYCFEMEGLTKKGSGQSSCSTASSSSIPKPLQNPNRIGMLQSASDGAINKADSRVSLSTSDLGHIPLQLSKSSGTSLTSSKNHRLTVKRSEIQISNSDNNSFYSVSESFSGNSMLSSGSNSRIFNAPLRNSLSVSQVSALTAFNVKKHPLMTVSQTQSSPLIPVPSGTSLSVCTSNSSFSVKKPISISVDNLHLREEMTTNRNRSRGSIMRLQRVPLGLNHRNSTTDTTSELSEFDDRNVYDPRWTDNNNELGQPSDESVMLREVSDVYYPRWTDSNSELGQPSSESVLSREVSDVYYPRQTDNNNELGQPSGESVMSHEVSDVFPTLIDLPPSLHSRESFVVEKQHTIDSANAAGLPVIYSTDVYAEPSESETYVNTSTSSSSCTNSGPTKSSKEKIVLTDLLQHRDMCIDDSPHQNISIPSSVADLKVNLMPVLASLQSQIAHMENEAMLHRLKIQSDLEKFNTKMSQSKDTMSSSGSEYTTAHSNPEIVKMHTDTAAPSNPETVKVHTAVPSEPETGEIHTAVPSKPETEVSNITLTKDEHDSSSASVRAVNRKNLSDTWNDKPKLLQSMEQKLTTTKQKSKGKLEQKLEWKSEHQLPRNEDNEKTMASCVSNEIQNTKVSNSYQPLEEFPFSPIASNGQVFVEQTPQPLQACLPKKSDVDDQASPPQNIVPPKQPKVNVESEEACCNPWVSPIHTKAVDVTQAKKDQLIRSRLEERDRARKLAAQQRRKNRRTIQSTQTHQNEQHLTNDTQQVAQVFGFVYTGTVPSYIQPKLKSNVKIIRNAICSVCLAGEVNMSLKHKTLDELEKSSATHVLILFRDSNGFKFRGIYSYNQGDNSVTKIYGTGPKEIKEKMINHLYKYNSSLKEFREIPTKSLSLSVDGLTIKSEYWDTNRRRTRLY